MALGLLLGACASPPLATAPPAVAAAETLELPGRVAVPPADVAEVELPFPCEVTRLRVRPGDEVRAGQPVADLAFPDAAIRQQVAAAAWRETEQEYREALRRFSPRIESARRWVEEALATERRTLAGLRDGTFSRADYEAAVATRARAEDDLADAREYVRRLLLPRWRKLELARAEYWDAWRQREATSVVETPMEGRVTTVMPRLGPAGGEQEGPVVVVARAPRMAVQVDVPPEWAGRVVEGTAVAIRLPRSPDVEGRLREVTARDVFRDNPETGQQRGSRAEAQRITAVVEVPPEAREQLEIGQEVTVQLPLRPEEQVSSR